MSEEAERSLESEWLDECRTTSTREAYTRHIRTFTDWYRKPLKEFLALEPREMRHTAILFQNAATNGWKTRHGRALKPNSIISTLTALGSFCAFNDKPLRLRGKRVRPTIDLTSHAFSDTDLRRMFSVADTQEKAILATFCSLGWEVSSLLSLERTYLGNLILRAQEERKQFIYFIDQRKKTGAIRLGVLNPLAIEWISEWLKVPLERIQQSKGTLRWDVKRLFGYTTKEGVNSMIKHLARDAHVTVTGRVHTHQIRKWVMSGLSRAGFNEFQIKFVLGKAIPLTDMTYLQTLQQEVEARYPKAYAEYLDISGKKQALPINEEDMDKIMYLLDKFKEGKIKIEP
jgi:hypothetical protein